MSDQIRSARRALDQVASDLDRHAMRGEYIPRDRMTKLARIVRDAMAVYDQELTPPE